MFKVSCIQLKSNNNIYDNLRKTRKYIIKAVNQKTDFILTPEVSSLFSLNKLRTSLSIKRPFCMQNLVISFGSIFGLLP